MKPHSKLFEALNPGVLLIPAFIKIPTKNPKSPILGIPAALILSQAWYMARQRSDGWEYSPADWADKTGLSDDQISRALKLLCALGILSRWQRSCVRVFTYKINFSTLEKLLLSCATITAPARLCTTAPARLCTTAPARLSVTKHRSFCSKKRGDTKSTQQHGAKAPNPPPPSLDQWKDFAASISPTWAKSRDCKKVFLDLEAVGWTNRNGQPLKRWQAKCGALYEIWRAERGGRDQERADLANQVKPTWQPVAPSYSVPKANAKPEKNGRKAASELLKALG